MTAACPSTAMQITREAALVALGNAAIALFLTAVGVDGFLANLVYSQCIGLSILAAVRGMCHLRGRGRPGLPEAAVGIPLGGLAGFLLGTWANGLSLAVVVERYPRTLLVSAAGALMFGSIAVYFFFSRARLAEVQAEARTERLRRLEQEALAAQTELRLLQAQIEPHFLFNTLSTLIVLVDSDPDAARAMLLDLTALLRTSLARTRREAVALGEELDLLRAYLGIMARRMGTRLQWRIEADEALLGARLPPLLVQPLVENAIRHGLEPKPEGGSLGLRCERAGDRLEIVVEDSGLGLAEEARTGEGGVGLSNVRARLCACYGEAASLQIESNAAGGVTARLSIPYGHAAAPAHR